MCGAGGGGPMHDLHDGRAVGSGCALRPNEDGTVAAEAHEGDELTFPFVIVIRRLSQIAENAACC